MELILFPILHPKVPASKFFIAVFKVKTVILAPLLYIPCAATGHIKQYLIVNKF